MAIPLLLREVLLGLFGSNSSSNSEKDLQRQQNIQSVATSALPDIMSGPEFFQNPDRPVSILVCMTIMTKKEQKVSFF